MPEARFLKVIVVCLLLLNVGMLGFQFIHHPRPGGDEEHGRRHENTAEYLRRTLQLTDAQEDAYKILREKHHNYVLSARERMKAQKQRLYALMKTTDTTATAPLASVTIDSIMAEQRGVEQVTYQHFRQVRALCTPVQQQRFDEVIGEALENMR